MGCMRPRRSAENIQCPPFLPRNVLCLWGSFFSRVVESSGNRKDLTQPMDLSILQHFCRGSIRGPKFGILRSKHKEGR